MVLIHPKLYAEERKKGGDTYMKNENGSNFGVYGREGDPRSAIGGNAVERATSMNEGDWVPPRDIGYSGFKGEESQEKYQDEIAIVTNVKSRVNVAPISDPMPPVIQKLKRADGTDIKIRMPHSGRG